MDKRIFWQKALWASFLFHLILIPFGGWLLSKQPLVKPVPEKTIELAMVTLPAQTKEIAPAVNSLPKSPEKEKVQTPGRVARATVVSSPSTVSSSGAVANKAVPASDPGSPGKKATVRETTSSTGGDQSNPPTSTPTKPVVYLPPQLLQKVEPRYPEEARAKGREGTVLVRIQVLELILRMYFYPKGN